MTCLFPFLPKKFEFQPDYEKKNKNSSNQWLGWLGNRINWADLVFRQTFLKIRKIENISDFNLLIILF